MTAMASFSDCQRAFIACDCSCRLANSSSSFDNRSIDAASVSFASATRSISS